MQVRNKSKLVLTLLALLICGIMTLPAESILAQAQPRLVFSTTTVEVNEGGSSTYTVKLNRNPGATVTVGIVSRDTDVATVSPSSLRFTTGNWDTAQTVTVSGVSDSDDATDESATIYHDASYSFGGFTGNVTANVNDRNGGVYLTLGVDAFFIDGDGLDIAVNLSHAPVNYSLPIALLFDGETAQNRHPNPNHASNKVTAGQIEFDIGETGPKTISVGIDSDWQNRLDEITDITVTIDANRIGEGSLDPRYEPNRRILGSITIPGETDPEFVVSESSFWLNEPIGSDTSNSSDTYTVRLSSPPTDTVTVTILSLNENAVTVSPASLTFTQDNWSTEQTITVQAQEDHDNADDETVYITHTGSGGGYDDILSTAEVRVRDSHGAVYLALGPDQVFDDGDGIPVTVSVSHVPSSPMTVKLLFNGHAAQTHTGKPSHNSNKVTVDPASVSFEGGDSGPKTINVEAHENWDVTEDVQIYVTSKLTFTGPSDPRFQGVRLIHHAYDGEIYIPTVPPNPIVTGISITSSPGSDGTYDLDDFVDFTVEFNRRVSIKAGETIEVELYAEPESEGAEADILQTVKAYYNGDGEFYNVDDPYGDRPERTKRFRYRVGAQHYAPGGVGIAAANEDDEEEEEENEDGEDNEDKGDSGDDSDVDASPLLDVMTPERTQFDVSIPGLARDEDHTVDARDDTVWDVTAQIASTPAEDSTYINGEIVRFRIPTEWVDEDGNEYDVAGEPRDESWIFVNVGGTRGVATYDELAEGPEGLDYWYFNFWVQGRTNVDLNGIGLFQTRLRIFENNELTGDLVVQEMGDQPEHKVDSRIGYPEEFCRRNGRDPLCHETPVFGPIGITDPAPAPAPTPAPKPEPSPGPAPAPTPGPAPGPAPTPEPKPDPKPKPAPTPDPTQPPIPGPGFGPGVGPGAGINPPSSG